MKKYLLISLATVLVLALSLSLLFLDFGDGDTSGGENPSETPHTHEQSDPVVENLVEATCESDGSYDSVVYCASCNKELERTSAVIEKQGHSLEEWSIDSFKCVGENLRERVCSVCSYKESEKIVAPGHNFENGSCSLCGTEERSVFDPIIITIQNEDYGKTEYSFHKNLDTFLAACRDSFLEDLSLISKYDSEYFENNSLIIAPVIQSSGLEGFEIHTYADGFTYNVRIEDPIDPPNSAGVTMVSFVCLLIEIPNDSYEGCNLIALWDEGKIVAEFVVGDSCEHTALYTFITEPTCTKEGHEKTVCLKCDITVSDNVLDAKGHTYGAWQTIPANGCASIEYSVRLCLVCGASDYDIDEIGVTHPHDFDATYTSPTCTEPGRAYIVCKNCGIVGADELLAPLGHNMNWVLTETTHSRECVRVGCDYKTDAEPHYGESGSPCLDTRCDYCGYILEEGLGHSFSLEYSTDEQNHWRECMRDGCDYVSDFAKHSASDAICTDRFAICDICRENFVPNGAHVLGNWYVVTNATCSTVGELRRDCIYCDYYVTMYVPRQPHNMGAWYVVTAPTETESGLSRRDCQNCDYYETRNIPATGHDLGDWNIIKSPTCTEDGIAEAKCKNCDYVYQRTIAAYGHICYNWHTVKEPTCTESGLSDGYCSRCGEYLTRTEAPLDHTYGSYCSSFDYHWRVCVRCGVSTEREVHRGGKATCTTYARCSVCRAYYGDEPTGHIFDTELSFDESGHYYPCINDGCNEKSDYESHKIVAKTESFETTDTGSQIIYTHVLYYECTVCAYRNEYHRVIGSEHYGCKILEAKEPTCTESGLTWGYACSVPGCSEVYLAQEIIPALGHNYVGGVCTRCGDREGTDTPGGDNPGENPGGEIPGTHTHVPAPAVIENRVEGNCTEGGYYYEVVYCATCFDELSRVRKTTPPNGNHVPASPVVENRVEPTCKNDGSYDRVIYCSLCSDELSRTSVIINKTNNHTPAASVREKYVSATCKEGGSYDDVVYCSTCGKELSRTTVKTDKTDNHTPSTPVRENEIPATESEEGSYDEVVYCSLCGNEVSRTKKIIGKLDHVHSPASAVIEGRVEHTCTVDGRYYSVVYCSSCGEELSRETRVLTAPGHTPSAAVEENRVEPSCTVDGSYDEVVYCSACGEGISRTAKSLTAPGHTLSAAVEENRVEPSCTVDGSYDEVIYCSVCSGEISRTPKTITAPGHIPQTPVIENRVQPTCTVDGGYDEVVYCSVCGEEISRTAKPLTAPGHTPSAAVEENRVEPTCTVDGSYDEVVYCSVCNEEVSRTAKPITAPGHTPSAAVEENRVEPTTCTVDGSYDEVVYCSVCNEEVSRTAKPITAPGHTPSAAVEENRVEPTCTVDGNYDSAVYCTDCGEELSRETITVPVLENAHIYSNVWTSNDKYHWYASTCGHEEAILDKARHSWDNGTLENGEECSSNAIVIYKCTVCSAEKQESAITHLYLEKERKTETCTENGYLLSICSVCGDEQIEIIYATGHAITNFEYHTEPLCETAGSSTGYCDACSEYVTITTPAVGHTSSEFYFVDDYCGTQMLGYVICTECGITIAEFGHSYRLTITKVTCDTDGQKLYECSNCNHSYSESIESPGHLAGEWLVTVDADCKTSGEETQYCLVCENAIQTREINKAEHSYTSTLSAGGVTYTCSICSDTYFIETQEHITISFVPNGGTEYQALEVGKGETADLPSPTKTDCEFAGWYLDSELKNKCNSTYVFNSDTTLYAAWNVSKLTGDLDTNNIITDVPLSYTFQVQSDVVLTNTNLKNYLFAKDLNEATPDLYIASSEGNIYTIAGRGYKKGMSYDVVAREGVSIVGITGNEFWFVIEKENTSNIKFKTGVIFISELDIYSFYEQDDKMYIFFRNDILNPGDIAVIYGDSTQDILLMLEVMAEGSAENAYVYQIEAAKSEDVFSEYDVYYSGELNIENIEFEANLEEELTAQVLASPMYAQFRQTAVAFSRGVTVGNYYYDFNGITVKPSFNSKDSKIFFSITVTAEFARMEINTREVDSLLHITLEVKSTLTFNTTAQVSGFDNFMFVVDVKNTTQVNLFVSLGTKQESKMELNYFKELLFKAKDEGKFSELDASYAENSKETILGSVSVNYCGIIFTFDVSNVFSFQVVGEIGVSAQIDVAASFGVKNTPSGGFSTIKSFKASASLSFYMLGKIEVSDMIKVRATVSLCGIVNAYVDISAGPYFMVGGMFTTSIHTGGGSATAFGGYLEIGAKVNATAGVNAKINIKIFRWRKTITIFDKSWTLYSQKFVLYSLGNQKVALYFTDVDESIDGEYICGSEVDVSKLIDLNVVMQDLTKMNKTTQKAECQFFLYGEYQNVRLTRDGKLTIYFNELQNLEVRIKVVSGDLYKYATLTFNFVHNEKLSKHQEPTCENAGNTEYVYCSGCLKVLSGINEIIPAPGHIPSAAVEENRVESTCTVDGGYDEVVYCSVCNEEISRIVKPITAPGHIPSAAVEENRVEFTCTVDGGYDEVVYCSVCNEEISRIVKPITAPGHNYINGACTICGKAEERFGFTFRLLEDETYSLIGYTGTPVNVVIPSTYNGKAVTSIGPYAFYNCTSLTSIEIPSSVTSIDYMAFTDCASLTSIEIPDSVTSIGDLAFCDCTSLTSVTIPDSVTSTGNRTFSGCASLTRIVIPDSVTSIGWGAFYDCFSLTSIEIPDSVTSIDNFAFENCTRLTSVIIPDSVTSISERMFYGCTSLTSIEIPDSGISVGTEAFYDCYKLVEVINKSSLNITAGSEDYGYVAYYAKEVHNGESKIVNKDDYLFYTYNGVNYLLGYAGNDTDLILPENYNGESYEIYQYAFYKRDDIMSVVIPNSVTSIGYEAFFYCTSLTSVVIGDSVTSIGDYAFYWCTSLTSVVIGDSVTSIGDYAFSDCEKLVEVINKSSLDITVGSHSNGDVAYYAKEVHSGESKIVNKNGYLFYTYNGVNYLLGYAGDDTALALPTSYNGKSYEIYDYAFYWCTSLTSIEIPDSVTSIGDLAFCDCTSLTSVTIPDSVTSIGWGAFESCTSLTSVTIGNSVTSIDVDAFRWCTSLTSVTIPDSVTIIGWGAFEDCTSLTSVTFKNTSGWWVSATPPATSGTSISSSALSNTSTAAKYLTDTYYEYYWYRD